MTKRRLPCPHCGEEFEVVVQSPPRPKPAEPDPPGLEEDLSLIARAYELKFPEGRVTPKARDCARKLLRAGAPVSDLVEAIWGCHCSDFHLRAGRTQLSWILKDREKVELFRGKLRKATAHLTDRSAGTVGAVARFIEKERGET